MNDVGKSFLEGTKVQYLSESDQSKGVAQPTLELPYDNSKNIVELPDPKSLNVKTRLLDAVENRRTIRKYSNSPLTMTELSYLLWCTQGVKKVSTRPSTARNVPSAGARHAFETYLLINRVTGLKPGLYRFLAIEHKLLEIDTDPRWPDILKEACLGQSMITTSAATFFWAAVPYRMTWRYVERGYRYLLLDAGHVCQNLYLAAEGVDCGVCAVASYSDDELNRALGFDGENQFVIYAGTVGKKQ